MKYFLIMCLFFWMFITPARAGKILFFDDFSKYEAGSDGSPTWTIHEGNWSVTEEGYKGENGGAGGYCASGASAGSEDWQDYVFSLKFKILSRGKDWRDGAWIGFRYQNPENNYTLGFYFDRGIFLHKISEGSIASDENHLAKSPILLRDDKWHNLEIKVQGNIFSIKLDGKTIIDVVDKNWNEAPCIPKGKIMLSARYCSGIGGTTAVLFKDIKVEEIKVEKISMQSKEEVKKESTKPVVKESEEISNGPIKIKLVLSNGEVSGFNVYTKSGFLCPIKLSSQNAMLGKKYRKEGNVFEIKDLYFPNSNACVLDKNSFIKIALIQDDSFPEISFRLKLERFDSSKWEQDFGRIPFHFLSCFMEEAEIFHQRGWNIPTPKLDPYPLLQGREGVVVSRWSRNWSYAPPIGTYALPVVGLWAPKEKKYIAYEFQGTRLTENSEKYIASSYCWQQGDDRQFFTLVWPYAKGVGTELRYPQDGDLIQSYFRFIYNLEMPGDKTPNQFFQEYIWSRYKDLLPSSPSLNDLSWLPGEIQYRAFPVPGGVLLVDRNDPFTVPGTVVPCGWNSPYLQPIDYLYVMNVRRKVEEIKKDLVYLLQKAKKFKVGNDECIYWEKPIEGNWKPEFGEGVTSLHNVNGWGIANVLLGIYKNEKLPEYLPYIEGVFNWTKHILFTRNGYSDVPEAMFTLGANGISFCLEYYWTFRNDPERKERAYKAIELARMLTYRYLVIFTSDNDKEDIIESSFLIEPNSGTPWLGAACSNECSELLYAMTEVYVATGDPVLRHFINGMLERWHLLYRDINYPSIKKYPRASFAECYGLFEGVATEKGKRSLGGDINPVFAMLLFPVGQAKARVICGEKGAIAFNKEGIHTDISEYRYSGTGFSLKVNSVLDENFDLIISFPFLDLREKEVFIKRGSEFKKLEKDKDYECANRSFFSVYLRGIKNGDVVAVGKFDESIPVIPSQSIKSQVLKSPSFENFGFRTIDLASFTNKTLDFSWDDSISYAPFLPGEHFAYGVPYFLISPSLNSGKVCMTTGEIPLNFSPAHLFFFVSELNNKSRLEILYSGGEKEEVNLKDVFPVFRGWPPLFTCGIDMVFHRTKGKEIRTIRLQDVNLFAVTSVIQSTPYSSKALDIISAKRNEAQAKIQAEQKKLKMKELAKKEGGVLFQDDFKKYSIGSDGSPTWTIQGGSWIVTEEGYQGENCSGGYAALGASAGSEEWADYIISLKFKVVSPGFDWRDGVWIGFRHQDINNNYTLGFYLIGTYLHKVSEGVSTVDANPFALNPVRVNDKKWHDLEIRIKDNYIFISLDGKDIIECFDENWNDVPYLQKGKIVLSARGCVSGKNTTVIFKDVKVTEIKK